MLYTVHLVEQVSDSNANSSISMAAKASHQCCGIAELHTVDDRPSFIFVQSKFTVEVGIVKSLSCIHDKYDYSPRCNAT